MKFYPKSNDNNVGASQNAVDFRDSQIILKKILKNEFIRGFATLSASPSQSKAHAFSSVRLFRRRMIRQSCY